MDLLVEVRNATSDDQVIEAVSQWLTALPPIENISRAEERATMFAKAAHASTRYRDELMDLAVDDPDIREGLRRYALHRSRERCEVDPALVEFLLSDPPSKKQGRKTGSGSLFVEQMGMRYARAVWCVYQGGAGRYTLSASGKDTNNVFALVAKAAGTTFDVVRNSVKNGQLERLTKIALQSGARRVKKP